MKDHVLRLWRGEVGMARVFWEYAIAFGTLANLITTALAFGTYLATGSVLLGVIIFLLPLPYNVLIVVAVWRSASRYRGPPIWATLARVVVVAWALLATLV
jgi:hypothetical protein